MRRLEGGDRINPGILALAIFAGVLWTDVAFKQWAEVALTEPIRVTAWLYLAIRHNTGMFLGTLPVASVSLAHWLFLGVALICLGWRMVRTGSLAIGAGYALVTGGVMGNALGRVNGAVVDFLGFGPVVDDKWAFVNFADIAMLSGALLLGVVLVRGRTRARHAQAGEPARSSLFVPERDTSASCDESPNPCALAPSSRERQ